MEITKTHNKARLILFCAIAICILFLALWFLPRFLSSKKSTTNGTLQAVPTKSVVVPTNEPLVTPTIIPSSKSGWKTFMFASSDSKYSFEYPASWSAVEIDHDNIVRLNYAGHCKVEFSTNGGNEDKDNNDGTKTTKIYAGRTFDIVALKRENIPYLETFLLSNATPKDGFSVVNVVLPPSNTSPCQQTVDQILSSLKFGK